MVPDAREVGEDNYTVAAINGIRLSGFQSRFYTMPRFPLWTPFLLPIFYRTQLIEVLHFIFNVPT